MAKTTVTAFLLGVVGKVTHSVRNIQVRQPERGHVMHENDCILARTWVLLTGEPDEDAGNYDPPRPGLRTEEGECHKRRDEGDKEGQRGHRGRKLTSERAIK